MPRELSQTTPSGTSVTVRIGSEISSASAKAGQAFEGSLAHNLVRKARIAATGKEDAIIPAEHAITFRISSIGKHCFRG